MYSGPHSELLLPNNINVINNLNHSKCTNTICLIKSSHVNIIINFQFSKQNPLTRIIKNANINTTINGHTNPQINRIKPTQHFTPNRHLVKHINIDLIQYIYSK